MTTAVTLLPLMYEAKGIWRYRPIGKCLVEVNISANSTDPVTVTVMPDIKWRYLGISYFRVFSPPGVRTRIYISDWNNPAKEPSDSYLLADIDENQYDVRLTPRDYGLDKIYCDKFWIEVVPRSTENYERKAIVEFAGMEIK